MSAPYTVVVVSHESAGELEALLASLRRHLVPAPRVVVVDTGSRDASVGVARASGAEVIELAENPGFGAANNAGLERVGTPVTALLNPDVEAQDGSLSRLAERAQAQRALIAPRLIGHDGRLEKSAHPLPGGLEALAFGALGPGLPPPLRVRAEPWRSEQVREVGWAVGAALVARSDVLRELGPFDPTAFLFYEDLDLCLRARARGIPTVFDPTATLRHRGRHATLPVFAGEPYALLAARRREVVRARLGRRALALDDAAQALTFASRAMAKAILGRDAQRERHQLTALRTARRGPVAR